MNTETAIEEGNRIISEFNGLKIGASVYSWRPGCREPLQECHLAYHDQWGWLMPVVEKIEGLEKRRFGFTIDPFGVEIRDYANEEALIHEQDRYDCEPRIDTLYAAVVEFIKWYNTQSKTTEP